jgi:hypothetical protein
VSVASLPISFINSPHIQGICGRHAGFPTVGSSDICPRCTSAVNKSRIVHEVNAGLAFSPTFITVETMRDFTVGLCGLSSLNRIVILLAAHLSVHVWPIRPLSPGTHLAQQPHLRCAIVYIGPIFIPLIFTAAKTHRICGSYTSFSQPKHLPLVASWDSALVRCD